ncbi:MAG: PD-(D/E)XK nuclease domain-containing protein [Caldilineaceae bacterium]
MPADGGIAFQQPGDGVGCNFGLIRNGAHLIKEKAFDVQQLNEVKLRAISFNTYDIENLAIIPLLFQTGYLTIKDYDAETQLYTLAYPNYEVEDAFSAYLLSAFTEIETGFSESYLWRLIEALKAQDFQRFFAVLDVFFAHIPYDLHVDREKYYQTIFYLIFLLLGLRIEAEVKTKQGRIDAVVELKDQIVLFEFKLDDDAETALQQIKANAYYQKYQLKSKAMILVGVNFDSEKRKVARWKRDPA